MNWKIDHQLLALACLALAAPNWTGAYAGPSDYQCEVLEHLDLSDSGELKRPPRPIMIGQRFAIDRQTAQIVGPGLGLWNNPRVKFQMVSKNNSQNHFILLGREPGGQGTEHFTYIQVTEFADGPAKPFIVLSGSWVTSGICK